MVIGHSGTKKIARQGRSEMPNIHQDTAKLRRRHDSISSPWRVCDFCLLEVHNGKSDSDMFMTPLGEVHDYESFLRRLFEGAGRASQYQPARS